MPVRSLGYIHLDVVDVDAWQVFAKEFMGLMPTSAPVDGGHYFRMDHFPSRLAIHAADAARCAALGFEVNDRHELAEIASRVRAEGIDVEDGSPEQCAVRQVTGLIAFADPGGNPIEVFYGPVLDHVSVNTPHISGFVTGPQGMGHAIVSVGDDVQPAYDFYIRVLGMFERNSMRVGDSELFFLGCNERHHTLGVMPMPGPGRLIHLMLEVSTLDDVGQRARPVGTTRDSAPADARATHERPHGLVLRVLPGTLRGGDRVGRPSHSRSRPDVRNHAGRLLGPQVLTTARGFPRLIPKVG